MCVRARARVVSNAPPQAEAHLPYAPSLLYRYFTLKVQVTLSLNRSEQTEEVISHVLFE